MSEYKLQSIVCFDTDETTEIISMSVFFRTSREFVLGETQSFLYRWKRMIALLEWTPVTIYSCRHRPTIEELTNLFFRKNPLKLMMWGAINPALLLRIQGHAEGFRKALNEEKEIHGNTQAQEEFMKELEKA